MKRILVDWHSKDGNYCDTTTIEFNKRRPRDTVIKEKILNEHKHLGDISNIEIEILK